MAGLELEGKIALVTGGTRSIGRAITDKLLENGVKVAFNSLNPDGEDGKQLVAAHGENVLWIPADISNPETGLDLVKRTIDRFGKIDILVNNAGINRDTLLMRMSDEKWDEVLQANLYGSMRVTRAALRPMLRQESGGSIIFISSVSAHGNPGQANYAASKGGIEAFMKVVALEGASRNVRANAIAPGPVEETDMLDNLKPEQKDALISMVPMRRAIKRVEVANTVLFLASNMSSGITGQVINVDGGMIR